MNTECEARRDARDRVFMEDIIAEMPEEHILLWVIYPTAPLIELTPLKEGQDNGPSPYEEGQDPLTEAFDELCMHEKPIAELERARLCAREPKRPLGQNKNAASELSSSGRG
jgi:hypothetical protein